MSTIKPADAQAAFNSWATWRGLQRRPLNADSVALYETFWTSWCRHLAGLALPWHAAQPHHLAGFLAGNLRPVTQARYRRVLEEIYAHALRMEWIDSNPAAKQPDLPVHERPVSTAMHLLDRDRFIEGLQRGPDEQALRDRALVVLMAIEGLSVSEALSLRLADLLPSATAPQRVKITGERRSQSRELELDPRSIEALQQWLRVGKPLMDLALPDQPLLPDTRSKRWVKPLGRHAGFRIVRAALAHAVEQGHINTPPAEHGPSLLRNSALLAWIELGVPPVEVQRRAGLQRLDGLDRIVLRHAFGPVLERFQAQRHAERAAGLPQGAGV